MLYLSSWMVIDYLYFNDCLISSRAYFLCVLTRDRALEPTKVISSKTKVIEKVQLTDIIHQCLSACMNEWLTQLYINLLIHQTKVLLLSLLSQKASCTIMLLQSIY